MGHILPCAHAIALALLHELQIGSAEQWPAHRPATATDSGGHIASARALLQSVHSGNRVAIALLRL
jgi:hypothetical protein